MPSEGKTKVDELREALKAKKEAEERQAPAEKESAAPQGPDENLTVQIRAAEEEAKAHYDKLLRVMADFENFKKRNERERAEAIAFANQRLLGDLLPVLDHLDEALASVDITANGSEAVRSLSEGVELTRRQCLGILARYGLDPIEPEAGAPFDPAVHEAIAQVDAEGAGSGQVVARLRRGYKLHGRVLRAAMVSVAK
ncbi:MAG: nucleotide exchange factor GrpE [Deltaproteobacteria bacterium]|nr:nucleotide exchange factor GrpE [Deltaproteobacteria bacterium]